MLLKIALKKAGSLRNKVDTNLSTWQWWLLAGLCFEVFRRTMGWLDGLYRATLFPASVVEGQTSFSGERVKYFYSVLIENGTLDKYVQVQLADYGFMITMFFAMATLTIAAYRALPDQKHLKNFAWFLALVVPLAPFFDAMENLVSFAMLANPQDFPNWLAIVQSSFAVTKFALTGIGFVWSLLAGIIGLLAYLYSLIRKLAARA